jgi:DNA-binding response OmpR family regulator
MDRINVLLVEDEETLAMIIKDTLEAQGIFITTAPDGEKGLEKFFRIRPDVLVADVMMPKMDGFEMVKRIRKTDKLTPVLFLTARSAINDVVAGFELGANDYLKKPFGMQELIVRIKALAKRTKLYGQQSSVRRESEILIKIGKYQLNPTTQQLSIAGLSEELSNRESELLKMLAENRCDIVSTKDILLQLWGDDSFFNSRSLQVFITKLRHKLSRDENIKILNIRGVGYKLIE